MKLTAIELRVLGALLEKAATTPEHYPLTTNALLLACNQKSNREPVVTFDAKQVDEAILGLRQKGLARTIRPSSNRTFKHKHVVDEAMSLQSKERALLAILLLRGPQTPGELRTRTQRYCDFENLAEIEAALEKLSVGEEPLVQLCPRQPGQSQDRWQHMLGEETEPASQESEYIDAGVSAATSDKHSELHTLTERITELESRIAVLEELFA